MSDVPNSKKSPLTSFVSGLAAGLGDTIINYPPYGLHYRLGRGTNIWNWKYWTPKELYRGVIPYASIIPVTCFMDGISDLLKEKGVHPALAPFISGIISATFIATPVGNLIVIDQRLAESKKPAGPRNSYRDIQIHRGYNGFATGVYWLAGRDGIYSWSVFFAKGAIQKRLDCGDIAASTIAGTVATILTQPMDTSATYLQNQEHRITMREGVERMYREKGLRRFYRGVLFRWFAVVSGIYFMDKISTATKRYFE